VHELRARAPVRYRNRLAYCSQDRAGFIGLPEGERIEAPHDWFR